MSWLRRFFGRGNVTDGKPTANCIQFDAEGLKPVKSRRDKREWRDSLGNTLRLDVREGPAEHLTEPFDAESLRSICRRNVEAKGGAIVSVEVMDVVGIPCLETIEKYERRPAYEYEGSIIIPLADYHCSLTMHATVHGATGEREAVVTAHLLERGHIDPDAVERAADSDSRVIPGWFQDPYDSRYSGRTLHCASDDARLDILFPDHPLSRVRFCQNRIRNTLKIDRGVPSESQHAAGQREVYEGTPSIPLISGAAVASLFLQAGRPREAEELVSESLTEMQQSAAADRLATAEHCLQLGFACELQGKIEEAQFAFGRAKDDFEAVLGENHPTTAQAIVNLARTLIQQGKHDDAEPLFQRALTISKATEDRSSNAGIALNGIGLVYNARGRFSEAIPYFEDALEVFERVHGPDFPDVATVLRNMAYSWNKLGDHQRMREAWERAERVDPDGGR